MDGSPNLAKRIGLPLGPIAAILMILIGAPDGLAFSAWAIAALMVWMAVWWATEPIPIPVTSMLPMVAIPLIGAGSVREASAGYSSPIVMLLLGGFVIALGIERWGLHKRIALNLVSRVDRWIHAGNGAFVDVDFKHGHNLDDGTDRIVSRDRT